ncbi:MAG: hypothetical protein WAT22_19140 [Saprospiraceae bacterium]
MKYLTLFLLFVSISGWTQSGFTSLGGANFLGLSRAGVNLGGIKSIYLNQAGLTDIKDLGADISFERRFNLEELTNISIAGAKSFKFGTFGLLLSHFGFTEYSEQKFGISYAKKLHPNLSIGSQFELLRYNVEKVGSKNLFTVELGMQLKLNKEFSIATHVFSPGKSKITDATDLGTRVRLGVMYKPSNKVFMLIEMDKLIYRKPDFKIGVGYNMIQEAQINLGINPTLGFYSFGLHFNLKNIYRISSAVALNDNLGNSPALSLQYQK